MANTLNTFGLSEIALAVEEQLFKHGVKEESLLVIKVDSDFFKKVDEDLFYRNKEEGDDREFIPSEGEIDIKFDMLTIKIVDSKTEAKV